METVSNGGDDGVDASLAFGPDGYPAISHQDYANSDLKFSKFNGATWSTEIIDSASYHTSLAFGPNGQPAIAYQGDLNGDCKYARFDGMTWDIEIVDTNGGTDCRLTFGLDGQPAIGHLDSGRNVRFARKQIFQPYGGFRYQVEYVFSSRYGYDVQSFIGIRSSRRLIGVV